MLSTQALITPSDNMVTPHQPHGLPRILAVDLAATKKTRNCAVQKARLSRPELQDAVAHSVHPNRIFEVALDAARPPGLGRKRALDSIHFMTRSPTWTSHPGLLGHPGLFAADAGLTQARGDDLQPR